MKESGLVQEVQEKFPSWSCVKHRGGLWKADKKIIL